MTKLVQTDSTNPDFVSLVGLLDADLALRDGAAHAYYAQFNRIAHLNQVVVAYKENKPVGCGAIKKFDSGSMEVKRMYVLPEFRKAGIAAQILEALELWTRELGFNRCVLETGKRQPEAINLYQKCGYVVIPNYGQYVGVDNSVCFEKLLTATIRNWGK